MRFAFGKNWSRYSALVDEKRIASAEASLRAMLGMDSLSGKTFLDIGCGSGLFSLAAARLGASKIHSFDYDRDSVSTTLLLKGRFMPSASNWIVEGGDALDAKYMSALGQFDVVYSWGVLHHTGDMWKALDNASKTVKNGGKLFIALYNDQGFYSRCWLAVKKAYNLLPGVLKYLIIVPAFARLWGPAMLKDFLKLRPFATWKARREERGMSPWRDVIDWVGGYPFEVASVRNVAAFFRERGFEAEKTVSCGKGHGNNEYVFRRV